MISGNEKTRKAIEVVRRRREQQKPVRLLFVCLGNICRSPAAEEVMRCICRAEEGKQAVNDADDLTPRQQYKWMLDSAATSNYNVGLPADRRMLVHARRRDYNITHTARQICADDFNDFDLIIGMDANNLRNIKAVAPSPEAEDKVVSMAEFFSVATKYDYVPDPYYEGAEGFELVLDMLEDACRNLYDDITRR